MEVRFKKSIAFVMASILILFCGTSEVQAKKVYKINKIFLNTKQKRLVVGSTYQLRVKRVKPVRANKKVKWKSANKAIATVSKNGLVRAKRVGTTQIIVISKGNKRVKAKCKVVVIANSGNHSQDRINGGTSAITQGTMTTPVGVPGATANSVTIPTEQPSQKPDAPPLETPDVIPSENPDESASPDVTPSGEPTEEPSSKPDVFTVTFVNYDGSVIEVKEAVQNGSVKPPKEPVRRGYRFIGWDRDFDNIVSDVVVTALYEEDSTPTLFTQKITAQPGENVVEVEILIRNNPGILGMTLFVSFDENVLTLIDATNGEALHDVLTLTKAKVLKSGCKFVWDGQELTESDIKDGTALVLVFNISETAQSGDYEIALNYNDGDIIDNDLAPISFSLENGIIKINN